MNIPNRLTVLRVLMIPIFMICLYFNNIYLAILFFAAASITDNLDGYLARKNNQVTNFGKLMDPLADKLLTMSAFLCFIELGKIKAWIVMLILARELIITGMRMIALGENKVIAASKWGKLKTVSQLLTINIIMVGMIFEKHNMFLLQFNTVDNVLIVITAILTVYSGIDYIAKNWKLLNFK